VLAAGCGRVRGGFVLSADIPATGRFIPLGIMSAPCRPFLAAAQDLQNEAGDPLAREILTYGLASNLAGLTVLAAPSTQTALRACLFAKLVSEWRIAIPKIGVLQALFTIARLEPVQNAEGVFELALRLAGKPELLAEEAEVAWLQ
jgi:hypothetical protein